MNLDALTIFSILSSLAAILSAIYAVVSIEKQKHITKWNTNYELLSRTSTLLLAHPHLLALYGVSVDELKKDGITVEELVFIYMHLDASSLFYRISSDRRVKLTEFRKHFLSNDKIRIAWKKHMRNKLFGPSAWTKAVDEHVNSFDRTT